MSHSARTTAPLDSPHPPTDPAKRVWLDGELVPADRAAVSVFDHGLLYGDGVFEGIRLYNGRVLKLRTHLQRLAESARSIHLDPPYSLDEMDRATRAVVEANRLNDGYIRLCKRRLHPPLCHARHRHAGHQPLPVPQALDLHHR